jgi:hypothetical protein
LVAANGQRQQKAAPDFKFQPTLSLLFNKYQLSIYAGLALADFFYRQLRYECPVVQASGRVEDLK